ncbi:MAG: Pr6Pr family membrane protein [Candidatus Nanopelagicales bacterium]
MTSQPATAPPHTPSRWARPLFGINALVAWSGVLLQFVLTSLGTYPSENTVSSILGNPDQGALGRIFDYFTYFTILSNILVAVMMTLLFINPSRDGRIFRVLRLDTILMITVTGVVYNLILAGDGPGPVAWGAVANSLEHQITPVLTVVVWLVVGPRGWINAKVVAYSFVLPVAWLIYALIRGAIIDAYPYPFLDVIANGYGTVFINVIGIIIFALILNLIFWGIDWLYERGRSRR